MATLLEEITVNTQVVDISNKSNVENESKDKSKSEAVKEEEVVVENELKLTPEVKLEKNEVAVEVEPKTGSSFPVELNDKMKVCGVGVRKKTFIGIAIKIYSFGIYADTEALKELMRSKIMNAPAKPTEEMYQEAIDSDVEMTVRMVVVYGGLTMGLVRKNFDETLSAYIRKYNNGKNDDAALNKLMGKEVEKIKLSAGSVIELTKLPGYTLQIKVMGKVEGGVQSKLVCRAYFDMYLGDVPFDNTAKEKFGMSLVSLF